MPATDWGWQITPEELESWILSRTADLLVLNKPPHVVCHPSRFGPWSSLIGACREYLGAERLHMPFRLDRETTGVLLFASDRETGVRLQRSVQQSQFRKEYIAILQGELREPVTVSSPIGPDVGAEFYSRQTVRSDGQAAVTRFEPTDWRDGNTWVRVFPETGRRHQIRVHAGSIDHPLVGDKLYGPDPSLMMEFIQSGFSESLLSRIALPRHALHAAEVAFTTALGQEVFRAPVAPDMEAFWHGSRLADSR